MSLPSSVAPDLIAKLRYLSDEYMAECKRNGDHDICYACEVAVPLQEAVQALEEAQGKLDRLRASVENGDNPSLVIAAILDEGNPQ